METPIKEPPVGEPVFARDSERSFLPPLIIGAALILAGFATRYAIGRVMSDAGAYVLFVLLSGTGVIIFAIGLLLLWFYRDPERKGSGGLLSPADGRVILVDEKDDEHVGKAKRIAIFMSPLDVHVNRVPTSGELLAIHHSPGGYLPAFHKDSERNERLTTHWRATGKDEDGLPPGAPFTLVQIAGTLARRIYPWVQPGDEVAKGQRYGIIKFGSRVDLYLPPGVEPSVRPGDRVKAGKHVVAQATATTQEPAKEKQEQTVVA